MHTQIMRIVVGGNKVKKEIKRTKNSDPTHGNVEKKNSYLNLTSRQHANNNNNGKQQQAKSLAVGGASFRLAKKKMRVPN